MLVPTATAFAATTRGTSRSDRLSGTNGADRIDGRSGPDRIDGRGGRDHLRGGDGADRLSGGAGHDALTGGGGADRLVGGAGRDRLDGSSGNDVLEGSADADVLRGGAGNDMLRDAGGIDVFEGGAGDDAIDARDGVADRVVCGEGRDTVAADAADVVAEDCEIRPPAEQPGATSRTGGWALCNEVLMLRPEPGLSTTPRPTAITITGEFSDCMSSDPAIKSGTATLNSASPLGSCTAGTLDGLANITWNTGRTSRVVATGVFAGAGVLARGAVVDGTAFVGQSFLAYDTFALGAEELQACATPEGLTMARADGRIFIGVPFIGP